MANLEQFKQLFNPRPGNHFLQVTTKEDEISLVLQEMMDKVSGILNIAFYNEDNLKLNQPFRALPRDSDIVIIKDVYMSHENQNMLLKLSYLTLANSAEIIIMEKKGLMELDAVKQKLEDFEFRTANTIDIVDGYDLVIAKKMHMWGNGL